MEPVAQIAGSQIVPVPVVRAPSKVFKRELEVELQDLGRRNSLYYTTDGSEPSSKSTRFVKPFVIDRDTTVKAIAIDARGNRSAIVTAVFHRLPHEWSLKLRQCGAG